MANNRYEIKIPADQIDFIRRESKPTVTTVELCRRFNDRFKTAINYDAFKYMRRRLAPGTGSSREARNKLMAAKLSSPLGAEIIHSYGYTLIRTNRRNGHRGWVYKHRLIWENAYGPLLPNHGLFFLDQDKTNFRLDNLMAINWKFYGFLRNGKVNLLALKDPEMVKTLVAMNFLVAQTQVLYRHRRTAKKYQNLPPIYEPTGRPGYAY